MHGCGFQNVPTPPGCTRVTPAEGVCFLPSLPSKVIWNGAQDRPRNAMPALARSPYVGPRVCPVGPVVFYPTPAVNPQGSGSSYPPAGQVIFFLDLSL